jgi:hypothetical protein
MFRAAQRALSMDEGTRGRRRQIVDAPRSRTRKLGPHLLYGLVIKKIDDYGV